MTPPGEKIISPGTLVLPGDVNNPGKLGYQPEGLTPKLQPWDMDQPDTTAPTLYLPTYGTYPLESTTLTVTPLQVNGQPAPTFNAPATQDAPKHVLPAWAFPVGVLILLYLLSRGNK